MAGMKQKVTDEDVEIMKILRERGFTLKSIANLYNCHFTLVEYYTTPGRMEYVREYNKGWYYRKRINSMSPREIAKNFK